MAGLDGVDKKVCDFRWWRERSGRIFLRHTAVEEVSDDREEQD